MIEDGEDERTYESEGPRRYGPGSCAEAPTITQPRLARVLLIIIIVLLVLWTPGYYGYGRSRWGWGYGGDLLTLILVVILIWALIGGRP